MPRPLIAQTRPAQLAPDVRWRLAAHTHARLDAFLPHAFGGHDRRRRGRVPRRSEPWPDGSHTARGLLAARGRTPCRAPPRAARRASSPRSSAACNSDSAPSVDRCSTARAKIAPRLARDTSCSRSRVSASADGCTSSASSVSQVVLLRPRHVISNPLASARAFAHAPSRVLASSASTWIRRHHYEGAKASARCGGRSAPTKHQTLVGGGSNA